MRGDNFQNVPSHSINTGDGAAVTPFPWDNGHFSIPAYHFWIVQSFPSEDAISTSNERLTFSNNGFASCSQKSRSC